MQNTPADYSMLSLVQNAVLVGFHKGTLQTQMLKERQISYQ